MRKELGVDKLIKNYQGKMTATALSFLLLEDLKNCACCIFGETENDEAILLAKLEMIPDSLYYEKFDQRLEFTVAGEIISDQYVPLTYEVTGLKYCFYGRCSVIPKVCGVDLYLSASYTGRIGDKVKQRFCVSVDRLLKICRA